MDAYPIKTIEGLQELPARSIVQGHDGYRHEKRLRGWLLIVEQATALHRAADIELPARALYIPGRLPAYYLSWQEVQ